MKIGTRTLAVLLLTLSLLLGATPAVLGAAPPPPPDAAADLPVDDPAPETRADPELPSGVSTDWWTQAQQDIQTAEYNVTWQEQPELSDIGAAYQAPNRSQNLRTYFTQDGLRVIPRVYEGALPWQLALRLVSVNGQGAAPAALTADGNRIAYARGVLTEQYVNDAAGLRQEFALTEPSGSGAGNGISLELALSAAGTLTANLTADGATLEFTTPDGTRVLSYVGLSVMDAAGRTLPARLDLPSPQQGEGLGVRLLLAAADAVYPVTVAAVIDGLATAAAWTAESNQAGANFGYSVGTAGDVNGDGYADVIVGAYAYDAGQTDEGRAFVYHGGASGLSATAAWTAESDQDYANFGRSVGGAGDVNGDGYADVIVGAVYYDAGQADEGRAFVYHGGPSGLSATAAWTAESDQAGAFFGIAVGGAGDVNGDGYADVIVGAPYYDNGEADEGRAFVYHGGPSGLSATAAWTGESNQTIAQFGWAVGTAGDVNGDGYADVIVGVRTYDNGQTDEGAAFVYHGSASGLSATAAWTGESNQASALSGQSVGTAGDVNGDGYADVIVGARNYDNGQTDEGRAFVYHGSASGLSGTAAWTAESDQAAAYFGYAVGTAGDVNGDGYADVIVGALTYDNGQADEGRAYVYHGGASGLSATAAWTAESDQASAQLGIAVGTAGDVNGDGYGDVLVSAPYYDNGQTNEGRVYLYYGNAGDGLHLLPRQRRADDSAPVAPGGQVISPNQARLAALGRTPFGRSDVAVQWEVKPEGTAFNGSGLGQGAWTDSGIAGASLNQLVSSLSFETRYRWRVRILGRPKGAAATSAVTYRSRWLYGGPFFTALSGPQTIAGVGQTNLLGQTAYVNFTNVGAPAVTTLTVRGYPNTLPPSYAAFPGYGVTTQVLRRYFTLESNAGATGFSLRLCLNYDDSEVTAVGATEASLQLCRWTGSTWACPTRSPSSDTSANLVCADQQQGFSNWAIASATAPLAVELAGFSAEAQAGRVTVLWETVSETDNAGFNLYRGALEDGSDRLLLANMASQTPGASQGAAYQYVDAAVEAGQTYWYWLESVGLDGAKTLHGPVRVTVNAPTAVTLAGAQATRTSWPWAAGLAAALLIALGLARWR